MSLEEGWARAQLGMELVLENEKEVWRNHAWSLLRRFLPVAPGEFTADDLHEWWESHELGEPHHVNAYGALIRRARNEGLLIPTERTRQSTRTQRHASMVPIYRAGAWS